MEFHGSRLIKGYVLLEQLGEGAYGAVYRAHQQHVERDVAIKVILPQYANQPDFIRRFETEAQLVAQLEHLHIVPLYDYWRDPEGAYLVMRLMKGGSLADTLHTRQPWQPEAAADLIDQVASALDAAHHKGVVHRDLKPANILLDEDGNAFLSDFGIAKQLDMDADSSQVENIQGTPAYITPEQVQSLPVTPQTDIYALGVLLYQLLVGQHPFPESSNAELVVKHIQEPLPYVRGSNSELSAALDEVIQRATAKNPADRYPDAASLAIDFRRALQLGAELPEIPEEEIYNPYKGLRAFQVADAGDFFGRETLTGQLLAHLASPAEAGRFLAVVGPSGSGKSSVVKAGLLPALQKGALPGSDRWFFTEMQPGSQPLNELALALLSISADPQIDLVQQLGRGKDGLVQAASSVLPDDQSQLLLVIDQFEELFSLVADESDRNHFLGLLHTAVTNPGSQLRIVLTLRADFYDRPLLHPHFGKLVEEHTVVVLPLTPEELELAILKPAEHAGVTLEDDLADAISADVVDQPGALPLLQYALTELFERREGRMLTHQAYQHIGGVLGALGRRAEEVFADLDPAGKAVARQVFLRLVTLGEGAEDTRRRVLLAELESLFTPPQFNEHPERSFIPDSAPGRRSGNEEVNEVLNSFGKARLLLFDHDPSTRSPTVEVAHEALLREWHRLRSWLDESRADIRMQVVLSNATADWREGGKESSFLLRGSRLAQFEVWAGETSLALTPDEQRFLEASLEFEAERKAQQAALERRSRNFLRALVAVFAVAAIIAVGLTIFAFNQQGIAQDNAATAVAEADARATQQVVAENETRARSTQQVIAEAAQGEAELQASIAAENEAEALAQKAIVEEQAREAQRQADLNQSRFLAAQSRLAEQANNRDLSLALAMAAVQIDDPPGEAELALSETAYSPATVQLFAGHEDVIQAAALTPDGSTLLSFSLDNTIRQWDIESGEEILRVDLPELDLPEDESPRRGAAFSPDGTKLLLGLEDLSLVLLDANSGEIIQRMAGHTSPIMKVAFSPDGQRAISGSGPIDHQNDPPPDADLSMRMWDLNTGEQLFQYNGHDHTIFDVKFLPDGHTAASGSWDGSLLIWNLDSGASLQRMVGETILERSLDDVDHVAISPDGSWAFANTGQNILNLWDLETGQLLRDWSSGFQQPSRLAISPDGRLAASGHLSGEIVIWDIDSGEILQVLTVDNVPEELIFTSSSDQLISSAGNTMRLWSLNNGAEVKRLEIEGISRDVAYSPDGRKAVSVELTGTLYHWDLETGHELLRLDLPDFSWDVAYTHDGKSAIVTLINGEVIQYDLSSGQEIKRFGGENESDGHLNSAFVDAIAISLDGKTVLTGSQGEERTLFLWDLETGEELMHFDTAIVFSVDISPDGRTALAGVDDNHVMIMWDLETSEALKVYKGHESLVWDVAYNPDGKTALSASWDRSLILWDLESGEIIHRLLGHQDRVREVAIHPEGNIAVSGSSDGNLILWDLQTGEAIRSYRVHPGQINGLAFSPDGSKVLSSGNDGLLIEWRIDKNLNELVTWTEDNRYVPELTCSERDQFNIEPLCE